MKHCDTDQVKPCPVCDAPAAEFTNDHSCWTIRCTNAKCGIKLERHALSCSLAKARKEARVAWNRRGPRGTTMLASASVPIKVGDLVRLRNEYTAKPMLVTYVARSSHEGIKRVFADGLAFLEPELVLDSLWCGAPPRKCEKIRIDKLSTKLRKPKGWVSPPALKPGDTVAHNHNGVLGEPAPSKEKPRRRYKTAQQLYAAVLKSQKDA